MRNTVVLAFSVFFAIRPSSAVQPEPPNKPEETFRVFVSTRTDEATEPDKDLLKASKELRKRVAKRKRWLEVSRTASDADIIVEVLSHRVEERFVSRLNGTGAHFQNFVTEEHTIDARVTVLGIATLMSGVDKTKSGGKLSRAADMLAKALETYCQQNYWELAERRKK